MTPNKESIGRLRELVLRSEGRTLEDERFTPGCLYLIKGENYRLAEENLLFIQLDHFYESESGLRTCLQPKEEPYEILGLPLTLERVLRALGGYGLLSVDRGRFRFNENCYWTLCLPAHEQEEETLQALIDIFTPVR
jgi:hypothetical protein